MRLLERSIQTYVPVDSTPNRTRMPLGSTYSAIKLRFIGSVTVATGAATVFEDSPLGYMRSIDLVLGSFPLRSHDARFLYFWNRLVFGTPPRLTAPSGSIGTSAFLAELVVPIEQPDLIGLLPRGFLLDSRGLSGVDTVVTTGTVADMMSPGAGTDTLVTPSINVTQVEVPTVAGQLSRMQFSRNAYPITGTGFFDVPPLPGLGVAYRGIVLHFTSGNADPIRATSDDTILTDASCFDSRGIRYYDATPYEVIRADNKRIYGLESMPAGYCFLDFARLHTLDDLLKTRDRFGGIQNVNIRLNIGAAPANTVVQVYPINALLVGPRR